MKRIVITLPDFITEEATHIVQLLDWGIDLIHLRKPNASLEAYQTLLESIPASYHKRLVLHEHFQLTALYSVYGVHLNSRNTTAPKNFKGSISCSCHAIEELKAKKEAYNYLFLSPIFNSISKQGYASKYPPNILKKATQEGIIDTKTIALGGVTADRIKQVKQYHFGGIAMLGDIWQRIYRSDIKDYISTLLRLTSKQ